MPRSANDATGGVPGMGDKRSAIYERYDELVERAGPSPPEEQQAPSPAGPLQAGPVPGDTPEATGEDGVEAPREASAQEPAEASAEEPERSGEQPAGEPGGAPEDSDGKTDSAGVESAAEVITREEFEKKFGKVRIRGKIAGEVVEAPVTEWIKAAGLERHLQKRLQALAEKERRLTAAMQPGGYAAPQPMSAPPVSGPWVPPPGVEDSPLARLSDEDVRKRYDEMFIESPWKAEQFRAAVDAARRQALAQAEARRADAAVREFRARQSDITDEDWLAMNDPQFISRHPEIGRAQARGDWEAVLDVAYAKYVQERAMSALEAARRRAAEEEAEQRRKAEAKRRGQIVRAASQPPPAERKAEETDETPEAYIARLRKQRLELRNAGRNVT